MKISMSQYHLLPIHLRMYFSPIRSHKNASRFFYQAKVSKRERTVNGAVECKHPTLKPIALMRYLCTLVSTPTGGIVLDPFAGSGTTYAAAALNGQDYVGVEQDPETAFMARMRVPAFLEDESYANHTDNETT